MVEAAQEDKKDGEFKTLAILRINGEIQTIAGKSIPDLRKKLREYPASSLVEVWRGKRLQLKKEVKVSF